MGKINNIILTAMTLVGHKYGSSVCCGRERGEAKAGDDPADMDVGSRPLTTDENCAIRSAFRSRMVPTVVA